jgi:hypothetical protein
MMSNGHGSNNTCWTPEFSAPQISTQVTTGKHASYCQLVRKLRPKIRA